MLISRNEGSVTDFFHDNFLLIRAFQEAQNILLHCSRKPHLTRPMYILFLWFGPECDEFIEPSVACIGQEEELPWSILKGIGPQCSDYRASATAQ